MRLALVLPVLMLAFVTLAPSAQAAAAGCALYNPAPPLPNLVPVPPPYPNTLGPATCVVVPLGPFAPPLTGLVFASGTPACPALPFVGPAPGQYCGPLIPPGATGICTAAVPVGLNIPLRAVVAGLDYSPSGLPAPADGNVFQTPPLDHEPLRYDNIPGPPFTYSVQVTNTLPFSARIIGYPVLQAQSPGPVLMLCV